MSIVDELVKYAGVDAKGVVDGHVHSYKVTLVLSGGGFIGGYFRGSITIEKTDDRKWPDGKVTFHIWLVAFGVAAKLSKKGGGLGFFTKIHQTMVGTAQSSIGWLPHDFPGQVEFFTMEASASAGVKGEAGGWFLHVHGRGGLALLEVVAEGAKLGVGGVGGEKIGGEVIGALGKITDKDLPTTGFPSMTQETDYAKNYGLATKTHFGFDSAVLTEEAREAVRALCANELVALMNPASHLRVTGHTDSKDTAEPNLTLSALRAANARQAIEDIVGTKLGAAIEARGLGEAEANKAGEQDLRNMDRRRVDIELNGRIVLRLREK